MSNDKPKAIVLGGTFPHKHLIELLQKRGYFTILVDFLDNPPAKASADVHVQKSTLDLDEVLEVAKNYEASLVIATCIDQANVTACYVSEKLGLPHPYSYETSLNVSDKVRMKRIMHDQNIPTSKHIEFESKEGLVESGLTFPLIVKPSDSNSSKGVRRANNIEEALTFVDAAFQVSRNKKVIVEEFKEGREIGLDCFIKDGQSYIIISRERRKIKKSKDTIQQIYGSFWPAQIPDEAFERFHQVIKGISKAFGLNNTPLLIQAIYNDDTGEINVLEFAPRIGGGDNYDIIKRSTGFDVIECSIDSFLGLDPNLDFKQPEFIFADNYIYVEDCTFSQMINYQPLIEEEVIEYAKVYKNKGAVISGDISSNNRVGVFTVKANSIEGILEKLEIANARIDVLDINQNSVIRKDIY